jgi:hypothetical protein
MYHVAEVHGFDERTVINIVRYLESEGLIISKALGGIISGKIAITHMGVKEVEQARRNPKSRTQHFPPMSSVTNIYNVKTKTFVGGGIKGKNIILGDEGTINANEETLTEIQNNKYAKSLKSFSQLINRQLEGQEIPEEQVKAINDNINELAKEVKDIKPGKEKNLKYSQRRAIEYKTASLIEQILNVLPEAAETAALFTPLAPFSKLIGKGVGKIVQYIQKNNAE